MTLSEFIRAPHERQAQWLRHEATPEDVHRLIEMRTSRVYALVATHAPLSYLHSHEVKQLSTSGAAGQLLLRRPGLSMRGRRRSSRVRERRSHATLLPRESRRPTCCTDPLSALLRHRFRDRARPGDAHSGSAKAGARGQKINEAACGEVEPRRAPKATRRRVQ